MAFDLGALSVAFKVDLSQFVVGLETASGKLSKFASTTGTSITAVGKTVEGFGKGAKELGAKLIPLGAGMTAFSALAIKSASDFEGAILKASQLTGKTGVALKEQQEALSKLALTMSQESVQSASQLAEAYGILIDKGINPATMSTEQLTAVQNLATGTGQDLATTTALLAGAMNSFGMATSETAKVADILGMTIRQAGTDVGTLENGISKLGPAARATGVSLEETTSLIATLDDLNVPAQLSVSALKKAFVDLANPTKNMTDVMGQLGVGMADIDLKTKSFSEVLAILDEKGISSTQTIQMFGDQVGPVITQLLSLDSSGKKAYMTFGNLTNTLEKSNGTIKTFAEASLGTLSGQMAVLKNSFESMLIPLGQAFIPLLKDMISAVREKVLVLKEWITANPELAKQLGTIALAIGPITLALGLFLSMAGNMIFVIAKLIQATGSLVQSLSLIPTIIATLSTKVFPAFIALLTGPAGAIALIGALAVAVGITIGKFIEWRQAVGNLQKGMQDFAVGQQGNFVRMLDAMKKNHEQQLKSNGALSAEYQIISDLVTKRGELVNKMMEDGNISAKENADLEKLNQTLIQHMNTYNELIRVKGDASQSSQDANSVANQDIALTQQQVDEKQKLIENLQRMGIVFNDLTAEEQSYYMATIVSSNETNKLGQSVNNANTEMQQMNDSLKNLTQTPHKILVDIAVEGSQEYISVSQEILRLEHQIALEKVTGAEKSRLALKFELEETLLALSLKAQAQKQNYLERIAQLDDLMLKEIDNINKDEKLTQEVKDAKIKAIKDEEAIKLESMARLNAEIFKGYELQMAQHNTLYQAKLKNIKEVDDALKQEQQTMSQILVSAPQATSMLEQLNNARNASAQYSTPQPMVKSGTVVAGSSYPTTNQLGGGSGVLSSGAKSSNPVGASAISGVLKSYQEGTDYVPSTGIYRLHRGEQVVPADQKGVNITIVNKIDGGFVNEMLQDDPNTIINIIGSDVAKGGTIYKSIVTASRRR